MLSVTYKDVNQILIHPSYINFKNQTRLNWTINVIDQIVSVNLVALCGEFQLKIQWHSTDYRTDFRNPGIFKYVAKLFTFTYIYTGIHLSEFIVEFIYHH
jgi:hypothetical protein